ncbi:MAG: hypothetical protein JW850_14955 [Thermoflexales bacterium]|nr:hypothetical protein [Thermoflexales bacterium]
MSKIGLALGLLSAAFGITLAALIGTRLSEQALSVALGAACGAGALLPAVGVLSFIAVRRSASTSGSYERTEAYPDRRAYPPVVVIAPPAAALPGGQQSSSYGPYYPPQAGITGRQFSIIGSSGEEMINNEHHTVW